MRIISGGHALFAGTLTAIGIAGLINGDFGAIWQPVPKDIPAREALAYVCAAISTGCGTALVWKRAAGAAARVLLIYLLLWLLLFRVPVIVAAPGAVVSWESCGETTVVLAGAWVVYAWLAAGRDRQRFSLAVGESGVRIARVLFGLALIAFGLSHFTYVKETAALVPDWLPSHVAWAYLTGCTYIAAGAAVLSGVYGRLAAVLAALQMGLFTLLVWVPIVAAGGSRFQWSEAVISWALTAGAWVVADSYRGLPWLREQALAPAARMRGMR